MNSPRRIAVAILLFAAGSVLERFAGAEGAAVIGLFTGLLVSSMIPAKGACGPETRPPAAQPPR